MLKQNNDDGFKVERLYKQYGKLMYKVAFGILNNKCDAEDAVQEAFIRIIKNLHKIDEKNCRKTLNFLVIICRNVAIDIYNKRNKIDTIEFEDNIDDFENSSSQIVINDESPNHLLELICTLKPIYQEVILLRFAHNYSVAEIATLLNIDTKTVQKRIERGKKNY